LIDDYLDGATPDDVETDLCIIGAGAAGITLAHSFIGTSIRVCIIESGGHTEEPVTQTLSAGNSIGPHPLELSDTRMRAFGGSCNLWGGGCIPLDRSDLERREWVPDSGWPLSWGNLESYYARARSFCGIDDTHGIEDGSFRSRLLRQPPVFDTRKLVNQTFIRTPMIFGDAYRSALERASNIQVLLHANLLELHPSNCGSSVRRATIGALNGRRGSVLARCYVLASGGIENARLLLLSNSVVPHGLGNDRDLVGRYFMDHPCVKLGTLTGAPDRFTAAYHRSQRRKKTAPAFPEICLSPEALQAHDLLKARMRPIPVEGPAPQGVRAMRDLRSVLGARARTRTRARRSRVADGGTVASVGGDCLRDDSAGLRGSAGIGKLSLRVGMGMGDITSAFCRKLASGYTVKSAHVDLYGFFEQAPNRDSRVTLGHETDSLGQRKVLVDWRLTPLDHHTYETAAKVFGTELERVSGGNFQPEPWLQRIGHTPPPVKGTAHHMGTTRMSDDPGQGVVDSQCRVHGIDNLYVAGSSVFPTGGWAFPTFSIVALSMRLADELRSVLPCLPIG
jgi:choline dehydrogenase-like flavoprotein